MFLQRYLPAGRSTPAAAQPFATPDPGKLKLASANAIIIDAADGTPVYSKAADEVTPIASLTKLMTAMVTLDAGLPLDEPVAVDVGDLDYIKGTRSRLGMGVELPRREMLRLALMASENRASSALARHYPGGTAAFVAAMNDKAVALGMRRTRFADATGLSADNVSTANDLARMVAAASQYPLIREYSTTASYFVEVQPSGRMLGFNNSNALVRDEHAGWDIVLSKTGYIREAGKCLVMLANIGSRPFVIVLLDSLGRYTRLGDAQRVRHWLETGEGLPVPGIKASARVGNGKVAPAVRKSSTVSRSRVTGSLPLRSTSRTAARGR